MELPDGAKHVQSILQGLDSDLRVEIMPESTATAIDAARAVGVEVAQIGKSIVFEANGNPIVAVLPGHKRVNMRLLIAEMNHDVASKPDPGWIYKNTGYRIGGVSPFGLPPTAEVIVDRSLGQHSVLYVAAGHPRAVVRVTYSQLIDLSNAREASISEG